MYNAITVKVSLLMPRFGNTLMKFSQKLHKKYFWYRASQPQHIFTIFLNLEVSQLRFFIECILIKKTCILSQTADD